MRRFVTALVLGIVLAGATAPQRPAFAQGWTPVPNQPPNVWEYVERGNSLAVIFVPSSIEPGFLAFKGVPLVYGEPYELIHITYTGMDNSGISLELRKASATSKERAAYREELARSNGDRFVALLKVFSADNFSRRVVPQSLRLPTPPTSLAIPLLTIRARLAQTAIGTTLYARVVP